MRYLILLYLFANQVHAQYDSSRIVEGLRNHRAIFFNNLPASLATDDETIVLRAYLMKTVVCQIQSPAAKVLCKDLKSSEDLDSQNVEMLDFATNPANVDIVLRALVGVYQSAQAALTNGTALTKDPLKQLAAALA